MLTQTDTHIHTWPQESLCFYKTNIQLQICLIANRNLENMETRVAGFDFEWVFSM